MPTTGLFAGSLFAGTPVTADDGTTAYKLQVDTSGGGGTGAGANQVQGAGASGASAVGFPVGVGAVYNSTLPTYATGQRTDLQADSRGNLAILAKFGIATAADGISNNSIASATGSTQSSPSGSVTPLATAGYVFTPGGTWQRQTGDAVSTFSRSPPVAKSASAVTAGSTTSQQLFAASAARSRVLIQNQDAAINIFVNVGAAAVAGSGNLRIAPGATLELTGTSEAINLIAASGTPAICAWQF